MSSDPKITECNFDQQARFEMLSAYMDREASIEEKALVENWLATDSEFRRLHLQQLKLRRLLNDLPIPAQPDPAIAIAQVMAKIDKRSKQQRFAWGGLAIAATLIAALGSVFTVTSPAGQLQVANQIPFVTEEPLMIAMEKPIIALPKSMTK